MKLFGMLFLILLLVMIHSSLELHDTTKNLIMFDNEIMDLMSTMTTEKLDKLLVFLESFDTKLEQLVDLIDEDNQLPQVRSIILEYIEYLEKNWERRVPRCIGLDWEGHRLMKQYNWTEDNMDSLMTQVGGVQYDWECLEEILGMATTEPTTRRTRPTRSIYKRKPTGSILNR